MAAKTRRYRTIHSRLRFALDPNKPEAVKYSDKVTVHVGGGAGAVIAFLDTLNQTKGFKADGLTLLPGEVVPDPTVRELMIAIVDNYLRRGWQIT